MTDVKQTYMISSLPGCRRDGTNLDGDYFTDVQWCRFQRGRPKKMGGFQQITSQLSGPIRNALVWSRESMNAVYTFSTYGIEMLLVDANGVGASIINRTPATGFTAGSATTNWSVATQYDDTVGTKVTVVLAHASNSLNNIDSTAATQPFWGAAAKDNAFEQLADAPAVSGGIFSVAPYTLVYGSDGYLAWSDINKPTRWHLSSGNIGDAGADRITGSKIVKGMALRSGSGPAGLLWSLDSVIRMDYAGSVSTFRFSHLSSQSSILSQNSVVEYDGTYFWMGIDRFLATNGSSVQELPNQMNINWVFDNLNYAQRQKVWAIRIPRYGEIHWYFPYGDADECTHCVIYNTREQLWYDNRNARSAGFASQVFRYPVMADSVESPSDQVLTLSGVTGTFAVGDIVQDSTGVRGVVTYVSGTTVRTHSLTDALMSTGALTDSTSGASATISTVRSLYAIYAHEKGTDRVIGDLVEPIESYFSTADFGYPTGGSQPNQTEGLNRWTRLIRIEPDFVQTGEMSVEVIGSEFAHAPDKISDPYVFGPDTQRIDMREQRREIHLKFTSNVAGGHYEMGRTLLHLEPGDIRS